MSASIGCRASLRCISKYSSRTSDWVGRDGQEMPTLDRNPNATSTARSLLPVVK